MDVLLLVAQGLPDRTIAARLYLSPRTVEKHVENAKGKLGLRQRSDIADLVTRIASLQGGGDTGIPPASTPARGPR
jgi:DNA-binding NarL/FixJ family response regulator